MNIAKTILGAAGALLLVASPAWAEQTKGDGARQGLPKADTNGDGNVSFEELSAVRPKVTREAFARLDRNGDGVLNRADRQAAAAQQAPQAGKQAGARKPGGAAAKIRACDKDGDGRVTFEEFSAGFPQATRERFDALDRNRDGALSKEDADGARAGADRNPSERPVNREDIGAKLRAADVNGDLRVSLPEAKAAMPRITPEQFGRLDKNGDGFISKDDRAQRP